MFTLTQDEFILLSQKANSPTLSGIAGSVPVENAAEAEAGLAGKGVLEGNVVNAKVKEIVDILDNAPERKVTRVNFMSQPYEALAEKGGKLAGIRQDNVKDWANHIISYTLGLEEGGDFLEALKTYCGFVETADNQQIRKFTSTVTLKNHQLFTDTFLKAGPMLAVKRYRRGYGLNTQEMFQFNMFLMPKPENFRFKYEENGKEIWCEALRSGGFQIIQVPDKNLFGQPGYKFYHLSLKKCVEGVQKAAKA